MATKKPVTELDTLLAELNLLTKRIAEVEVGDNTRTLKRARDKLDSFAERLSDVSISMDPIRRPASVFDPADPSTAGQIVALTLVAQERHALSEVPNFYGAGVYAIYYRGDFEPYRALSGTEHPIYVGKADPDPSAKKDVVSQGPKLSARLQEHAKSIRQAHSSIKIEDFDCRFLIVQTGFQKTAEDYLIKLFKPIWNSETKICFGLGKHGDSATTRVNKRSPWDTLHPGRKWADSTLENQKTYENIVELIGDHFEKNRPYSDIKEIFEKFMLNMRQLDLNKIYPPLK